ncbi:unnamed protein product [Closterium sp. NIES-54]
MGSSRMDHGRTSDVHDHANAALSNPILLWRGRKRERLADALRTTEGSQKVGGKLPTSVGVQTQDRKVRAETISELETSNADPVDQHLSDLILVAQGEDCGVTRVVVNDQQEVTLHPQTPGALRTTDEAAGATGSHERVAGAGIPAAQLRLDQLHLRRRRLCRLHPNRHCHRCLHLHRCHRRPHLCHHPHPHPLLRLHRHYLLPHHLL